MRILVLALIIFCACGSGNFELRDWLHDNKKIKVLATTAMIADLVREVGGEEVNVLVLIKGDLDPHSYQLVKGDDEKLSHADLIFANGLSLEHGPSLQHYLESDDKVHFLGDIFFKQSSSPLLYFRGKVDPHIWMDMSLWSQTIPLIVEVLAKTRPEQAQLFAARAKKLENTLKEAHQEIRNLLQQVPKEKRYLVTSHDAFSYFARAYLSEESEVKDNTWEVRFQAPEGLSPESSLSSKNISDILQHIKKYQIHVIFPESNVSADSLKKIQNAAHEQGLDVVLGNPFLYSDAMGPPGSDGDSYLKMLKHNAKTIAEDLNGL